MSSINDCLELLDLVFSLTTMDNSAQDQLIVTQFISAYWDVVNRVQ